MNTLQRLIVCTTVISGIAANNFTSLDEKDSNITFAKETCKSDNACENGMKCKKNWWADLGFCDCVEGLSGDTCEVIDDCTEDGFLQNCRGEKGTCKFNNGSAVCICNEGMAFDATEGVKYCKKCECKNGRCEVGESGLMECICPPEYGFSYNQCKKCNCGEGFSCNFYGIFKECLCTEGFVERNNKCERLETTEYTPRTPFIRITSNKNDQSSTRMATTPYYPWRTTGTYYTTHSNPVTRTGMTENTTPQVTDSTDKEKSKFAMYYKSVKEEEFFVLSQKDGLHVDKKLISTNNTLVNRFINMLKMI